MLLKTCLKETNFPYKKNMVMKINTRIPDFEKSMLSLSTKHYENAKYLTMMCTVPKSRKFGRSRIQNKMNRFSIFNNLLRNKVFKQQSFPESHSYKLIYLVCQTLQENQTFEMEHSLLNIFLFKLKK